MTTAYLDHLEGLTGGMLLGALIDAGADRNALETTLNAYTSFRITLSTDTIICQGLPASCITISTSGDVPSLTRTDLLAMSGAHPMADRLAGIWTRLFEAEAAFRHTSVDGLTLRDVGGESALTEILGVTEALAQLRIERLYSVPIALSPGLPATSPVVTMLATGVPIRYAEHALPVSPVGVALLTAFAVFTPPPVFTLLGAGYGAAPDSTGLLRLSLGDAYPDATVVSDDDDILVVETSIDDMNPQYYAHVVDLLLERGALDACLTPVIMKKGRPGAILSVLVERARLEDITSTILRETTTLGVRMYRVERRILPRRIVEVQTAFGPVRIKLARHGTLLRFTPEYDDLRRAARANGVPLPEVCEAVRTAADRLDLEGML